MALLLMSLMSIGCISAHDNADLNQTVLMDAVNVTNPVAIGLSDTEELNSTVSSSDSHASAKILSDDNLTDTTPESPDLIFNITNDNLKDYFIRGTLRNTYNNAILNITEDIVDMDLLTIKASNVTIIGNNHTLINTVFSVEANGLTLTNLTLNETGSFEDNEYAAILVYRADDVNILNVNINFLAARNEDAYAIYSLGTTWRKNLNLTIANCSINFTANNKNAGRAYAVKLEHSPGVLFENNSIDAYLSLRTVGFVGTTANLDSEFSLAVGVTNCDNLTFNNNTIGVHVNNRPECYYPTLDGIFICDSKNCNFTNNTLHMDDKITYKDEENYLYALDIYRNENMMVENNTIRVVTKGGAYAAGTAYPIQLTGPASGIVIKGNDIYSKSNGPNIGIYSQNFNGENYIMILNNYINVTGRAGNHSWALVAGIEVQDDNDTIIGNIIEVHNTGKVKKDDNIYGISYSQQTNSTHSYRVINNTVISDGYYLSYMLDAENTTVTNNTLVRSDKYADTDYDPFKRGSAIGNDTDASKNNDFAGNRVITIFEYGLEHQGNEIDGGQEFHYETPTNDKNISNNINGSGINPYSPDFPSGNPLIPGHNGGNTNPGNGNFFGPGGDPAFNNLPGLEDDDGESLSRKRGDDDGNNAQNFWNLQGLDDDDGNRQQNSFSNDMSSGVSYSKLVKNENSTSSISPSVSGVASSGSNSKSASSSNGAGSAGAVKSIDKAYEIIKKIEEDNSDSIIIFVGLAIICEMLLIIGYKRKENEEDY